MKFFKPSKTRFLPAAVVVALAILSLFPSVARASTYTVTEESEWSFSLSEADTVYIYGNSNRECNEPGADPYLWLYDDNPESTGALITQNDDGNHGAGQCVSSKIVAQLSAGDYLIRAGYCCSQRQLGTNPSGYSYELVIQNYDLSGGSPTTTTSTTTTTVPQTIGPPMNLTGEVTSDGVYLDWDAPNTGNVEPERYAISFRIPPDAGWGVATGNVGDENALNTDYTLPFSLFESTGGLGESYVFDVRADNDTMGIYSGWSTQVTLLVEEVTPSTTTTSTTTTSTTTTVPPTTTAPTTTTTTTSSTTTTIPVTTTTSTTTSTSTSTTSTTSPPTTTTTTSLPPTTTSTSTTTTTVRPATTTTSSPPTTTPTPPTTTVPVFEDPDDAAVAEELEDLGLDVSPEQVKEIDEAEIKVVEELDAISKELAEEYIDVIDGDVTVDDIKHLVEDDNFKDIPDDAKQTLVVALNEVDDEVKSEFEDAVNIFEDENYNDYVAAGSAITTEDRRTVVAATAAVAATAGAAAGPSGPKTSGGSGGGGGGGSDGPRKRGGSSRRSR